jgi:hypothetical protein
MSRFAKLFAANAIAAAGLGAAAIAMSATAAAEPALPPVMPGIPALNVIQQLASDPASMGGAVLQTAATALNGASAMVGAPAPNTLPISPIPGAPGVPAAPLPAAPAAPVAPALPSTGLVPLLNSFGVPANLVNLAPSEVPAAIGSSLGISPAAPVAAPLPTAPLVPAAPPLGTNPLPLLNALP